MTPPLAPHLSFRQVHLDFHTSPLIPGVAADFDAEQFARTLQGAHISSITCFAACHHGLSYYPTRVGTVHPHLTRDLLGEQIEACHRHGIRVPAYITVVWAEEQANQHPEWRQIGNDGRPAGRKPLGPIALARLAMAVHEQSLCRSCGGRGRRSGMRLSRRRPVSGYCDDRAARLRLPLLSAGHARSRTQSGKRPGSSPLRAQRRAPFHGTD